MTPNTRIRERRILSSLISWVNGQEIKDICQNYEMSEFEGFETFEELEDIVSSRGDRNREINKIRKHRLAEISLPRLADDVETEKAAFEFFQLNWIPEYNLRKLYIYFEEKGGVRVNPMTLFEIALVKERDKFVVDIMNYHEVNLLYYLSVEEEKNIERSGGHSPLKVLVSRALLRGKSNRFNNIESFAQGDTPFNLVYSIFKNSGYIGINSREFAALFEVYEEITTKNHTLFFRNSTTSKNESFSPCPISAIRSIFKKRLLSELEEVNYSLMKKIFKVMKNIILTTFSNTDIYKELEALKNKFDSFRDVTMLLYVDRRKDGIWGANVTSEIQLKIIGFLLGIDFESPAESEEKNEKQKKFVSEQRQIILNGKSKIVKTEVG